MGLRYLGNINKPGYNPLASNITTGTNVVQYQGIFTTQQQLQAITTGQWVTDPLFDYSTLLLQADGIANGSQNNTFLDSSTNNFTITRNGNTTQGSFSPFSLQPGAWGNYFDGSSRITLPSNAAFAFGTGAYTVEFYVYHIGLGGTQARFFDAGSASGSFGVGVNNTNTLSITNYGGANVLDTASNALVLNQWNHVAFVRDSTSSNATRIYVNGVLSVTGTDSNNWTVTTTPTIAGLGIAGYYPISYLSNLRITKGGALYTSNFTPSTAPLTTTVSAGTVSLLTCQSNRFIDNSANSFALTVAAGTPSVQAFSPFEPQYQYQPTVTGGSGYFDGTGDYVTWTGSAIGTSQFSFECWFYHTGTYASIQAMLGPNSATNGGISVRIASSTQIKIDRLGVGESVFTVPTMVANTWYHVVACRGASNTTTVFLNGTRSSTGTIADSYSYGNAASISYLNSSTPFPFTGYIADARLVVGSSVYDPTQTSITIPTAPLTAVTNTQLLLNYTNAGIYDATMKNDLETVGNASVSTSVVKYGSGSMYFDGTGDYLAIAARPSFAFGTGDFTIEFWMWSTVNSLDSFYRRIYVTDGPTGNAAGNFQISIVPTTGVINLWTNSGGLDVSGTSNVTDGVWHHIAAVRLNGILRLYVDGVQQLSTTYTTSISPNSGSPRPYIGSYDGTQGDYNGYLDDFRISNFARYMQNFIPPSVALPRQ